MTHLINLALGVVGSATDDARQAIKDAVEVGGLRSLRGINACSAAVFASGVDKSSGYDEERFVVADLGATHAEIASICVGASRGVCLCVCVPVCACVCLCVWACVCACV